MVRDIKKRFLFPYGKPKALVMAYDDGSEHDRKLISIFNRYGIRGTFPLNSGKLGDTYHILPSEVATLYRGHEVCSHSVSHPHLDKLSPEEVKKEILDDRKALEDLVGYPIRGFTMPFEANYEGLIELLPQLGIDYCRICECTNNFDLPQNFSLWKPSCHHNMALELSTRFIDAPDDEMLLLHIFGHSYEYDGFMTADSRKDWDYAEYLCRQLGQQDDVWYATAIEVYDYLTSIHRLKFTVDEKVVYNPSAISVWMRKEGMPIEIPPATLISL